MGCPRREAGPIPPRAGNVSHGFEQAGPRDSATSRFIALAV